MAGILPPTAKINVAYRQSIYQAGSVVSQIGHYPKGIPRHLNKSILVMLSAYNPGGRLKPLGWNMRMMQKLEQYLYHYEYFTGTGSLKEISEPLFMVNILVSKAILLARKFRQNAIVVIRSQRRSALVFLA